ncbi:MAG: TolC family protein [Kiritimatiellae bacterium]|nr:TolC family protein [Kiritimatiellia bacterium]
MTRHALLTWLWMLALAAGPAFPAEREAVLDDAATLEDYVAYAVSLNPGLQAAFHAWQAASERAAQERSLPDPRFKYEIEPVDDPQIHRFELSQMFPAGGKRGARAGMAARDAQAAQDRYEAARLGVANDVRQAYFDYYFLGRSIAIAEENVAFLQQLQATARARQDTGGPLSAVLQADVELGKMENELASLRDMRGAVTARLNEALGRPVGTPVPWPREIPAAQAALDPGQLLQALEKANPDLKELDAMAEREAEAIRVAKKESLPDVELGAEYTTFTDSQEDDMVMGMVALNLPLWRGSYRAMVHEAEAARRAALLAREDRSNALSSDLKMALYAFRDAERKIALYRDTLIPRADESLRSALDSYEAGREDFLSVLDAERVLLEFKLSLERARTDREQRLSEIGMLVGTDLPNMGGSPGRVSP